MTRHGGWDSYDRVIYVGDGGNDYCPVLRLRMFVFYLTFLLDRELKLDFLVPSQDVALVRAYRALQRRIEKEGDKTPVKAKIVFWGGAWEVEDFLLHN